MQAKTFSGFIIATVLLVVTSAISLRAQTTSSDNSGPLLAPADLEQLVAPIALYPDPLIALILTGSTVPTDIVLADRYVQNGQDPNAIDSQSWDDSVKGLARYPDVLKMMDDNLDWTNQLGAAVLTQQQDVMAAIQAQRAKAQSLGNLQSTPQQQVIDDQQIIQIVPADPQVIYVPVYDPQVVYIDRAPATPFITFGLGFAIGAWLGGGCDWHHHGIYSHGYYRPGYGWGNNVNININNNTNIWRPNPHKPKPRPPYRPNRPGGGGGNGHLPGWNRPPPGGNKPPGKPDKPGGPGNIKPPPNGGGNRPGGPGNRPGNGSDNRPGNGKPGGGNGNSPGGNGPDQTKPAPKPTKPQPGETRPGFGNGNRPSPTTRPARPETENKRPATTRPATPQVQRPAPSRPSVPAPRPGNFDQRKPDTKRPAPSATPRPQPSQPQAQPKAQRPPPPNRKSN